MQELDHEIVPNSYNKHAWIAGNPEIGEGVWIGAFCLIDGLHNTLRIGRGTNIASGAQILTHTTVKRCISERRYGKVDSKPTEIGEFCFIGANAVVLMGSKIGDHSVVAAGSVVPENTTVPAFSIVAGVPGKIVGNTNKLLNDVENESVSIVMPAYNEEENIEKVILQAVEELGKITKDFEVVVVDDGSTDSTGKIADRFAAKNKKVRVVHHIKNKGFTGAILSCYKSARKHLVFLAPADGEFDFREFRKFLDAIRGYDVAVGYRIDNTRSLIRKFNSKVFHFLCKILFDIKLKEISAVILWRRSVLVTLSINSGESSAMIEPELIYQALKKGCKFKEVPFHYLARTAGKSKGSNPFMIVKTLMEMAKFWYNSRFVSEKPPVSSFSTIHFNKSVFLQLLLLLVLGFTLLSPVLSFYFVNDDFSLLYNLHILNQSHAYPYQTIVPFFSPVYQLFHLNPIGYFLYGIFFFLISITVFFFFSQVLFGRRKHIPFLATLAYVVCPLGINSVLNAITFSVNYAEITLMLSILLSYTLFRREKKIQYFLAGVLLFAVAVVAIPFRSFLIMLILPLYELFCFTRLRFSGALLKSIMIIFPFVLVFFSYYLIFAPMISDENSTYRTSDLLQKAGTLLTPNIISLPLVGLGNVLISGFLLLFTKDGSVYQTPFTIPAIILLFGLIALGVFFRKEEKHIVRILFFSIAWIYCNILVYFMITIPGITEVIARHIIFSAPAYAITLICTRLLFEKMFIKRNFLQLLPYLFFISIVVINALTTYRYLYEFNVSRSRYAQVFFRDLKSVLPRIDKGMIIYVFSNTEADKIYRVQNIFTVGYYGYEAAFAIYYDIKQEDFRVVTTSDEAKYFLQQKPRKYSKIVGLYFARDETGKPILREATNEAIRRIAMP